MEEKIMENNAEIIDLVPAEEQETELAESNDGLGSLVVLGAGVAIGVAAAQIPKAIRFIKKKGSELKERLKNRSNPDNVVEGEFEVVEDEEVVEEAK